MSESETLTVTAAPQPKIIAIDANNCEPSPMPLHDIPKDQDYGASPEKVRSTEQYQEEYVENFVERWDELIDWEARAEGEGHRYIKEAG